MADDKKKKKGRRSYLSDFTQDVSGTYIYGGDHYSYVGNDLGRRLVLLWLCLIGAAAVTVIGGCIPSDAMKNSFYVIIPYILEVAALGFCAWYLFRLSHEEKPLRAYVYTATVPRLPRLSVFGMISAAAGAVGYTVFIILTAENGISAWTVTGLLLKIPMFWLLFAFCRLMKGQKWEKAEKKTVPYDC